jgi:hypothetical protein
MLTFTPDGTKVLVANEGEPNKDYSIDPEGSISVIDVSSGAASASVTSINFNSYNDKKESLKNKGIRIFGNNGSATVSQDLNELVTNWPALGIPTYDGGQPEVMLGGFSGLFFDEINSTETDYVFYAVPDRGPNDSPVKVADVTPTPTKNLRPFKLPNYQGRIVKFTLNKTNGTVTLDDQILLIPILIIQVDQKNITHYLLMLMEVTLKVF